MSARRFLAATTLCLLAIPAWAQMHPNSIANEPPEVDLVYPTPGQQLVIGSSMAMGATAFDADDGVQRVDFVVDGSTVATDLTDGYTGTWTVTSGSHTVAARATDNRGKSTTTPAITITTVPNTPPSVGLTTPTAGSSWTVGTALPMAATASDTDGTVVRVEFWIDNVNKGQDTSSPYAFSGWTVTPGDHAIKVKAVDDLGGITATSAINIHGNYLPTVTLTSPAAGNVPVNTAVTMSATASDSDGSINRVEFWVDGAEIAQDASSPYSRTWTASAPGPHTIQAVAFDNRSTMTATAPVTVTVTNTPPTINLTSPTAGSSWTVGTPLLMSADASDGDIGGSVDHVEFWIDNVKKSEDASAPYEYDGWIVTPGDHAIKAKAVDNLGAITSMSAINIHGNYLPTALLTSPSDGASYDAGDSVPMSATASDSDGSINRVEFWVDGVKYTQAATSPYNRNWTATTVGDHTIQALAFDNRGAMTPTAIVTIHISASTGNQRPDVTLESPEDRGSAPAGTAIDMRARASDADGSIEHVDFLVDTTNVIRATLDTVDGKYRASPNDLAIGSHTIVARAYDDDGAYGTSDPALITVTDPSNHAPTVILTSPTANQTPSAGAAVTLSAEPHDADGDATVDHVQFLVDGQDFAQAMSPGFSTTWTAAAGTHTISVVAVDDQGAVSEPASVTLDIPIPPPTRKYTYNSYQELCRVEEPETGVTLMGYDGAGNLTWSASGLSKDDYADCSNGSGVPRKVTRTYDARNRVSTLTFPDGNGNQSWGYTADGLPASVTTYNDALASSVTNTYAYNHRRLLTREQQQTASTTLTVDYAYDANGFLSALTYPDALPAGNRTIAYAPNALGQPTQAGTYATGVTYYPNGAISSFMYGNGIKHEMTQNARGLPAVSWDHNGPTTATLQDEYTYDQVGNVVAIIDAAPGRNQHGNREMYYDDLNRLTRVEAPAMFQIATYAYDAYDNLTHVHVTGGSQIRDQDYCYDENNRLTNVMTGGCEGGQSVIGLGYDVQGNLANKNGATYTFDYGNRLRAATPLTAAAETYAYDAQGRRIRSSSSVGQIDSLYSQSGQLLFQKDGRGSKRRQYVYLGGSLVAEVDLPLTGSTATVTYQHTDALGTPVAITNSSKTVTERRDYEPFGYQITPALKDGPNYTGHVADAATGMIYMQQRYYDPLCGCFLSVDPATAYSPGGAFNQYWYANASPYRFTDPDGRDPRRSSANEVYLASGGDWGSGQTVAAGKRNRSNTRVPYSESNTQQRLDAANKALAKLRKILLEKRTLTADGIAAYFAYLTQPISTKYTVEVFFHSSPSQDGWRIDEAHVSNEFWAGSGIGGGQSGNPLDLGETGGHTHPFDTPFSPQDLGALGVFYVSRPDGTMSVYNPYQGDQGKVTDLGINLWDY